MSDPYAALRVRAVRRYLSGRFLSTFGRQMLEVAVGWHLYERTGSALALGIVGLVQIVPVVVLALPVGHLVDRRNRRDVALAAETAWAGCALALAVASAAQAPVWITYVVLFAGGVVQSFASPASTSLMAQIVPREHFTNANAWRSSSFQLSATLGPAAAGALIALAHDVTWVYALDAAFSLTCAALLLSVARPPTPAPSHTGTPQKELRAGLDFVLGSPLLLAAILLDTFAVLFGGATALLPVFARDLLHVGPAGLGWLRAAPSIGALAMALVTTRLSPWRHAGRALLLAVAGFGLSTIGFGLSRSFALSLACLILTGVFDNVSVVIRLSLEQLVTPDHLRGRVSAVHYVFIGMSNEMGEFESGLTAALLGPVVSVVAGGVGTLLVIALVALRWPVLRRLGPLSSLRPNSAAAA